MSRSLVNIFRDVINKFGIEISRYPIHSTIDGHLKQLCASESIDVVLDVGANTGQFAQRLRERSKFEGRVFSFEPFPNAFLELQKQSENDKSWCAFNFALGDTDEPRILHTFSATDWNSLHSVDLHNLRKSGRTLQPTGQIDVTVKRLDSIWGALIPAHSRVLLKSDTQGHDLAVLRGVGENLAQVHCLILEASLLTFYAGEAEFCDAIEHLSGLGFGLSGVFPVSRSKGSLALNTVDICMVRVD